LIDLAESIGLAVKETRNTIEKKTFREEVDADWSYAYKMKSALNVKSETTN
jgi:predicted DsbA family dithiol-disulfide isomerase